MDFSFVGDDQLSLYDSLRSDNNDIRIKLFDLLSLLTDMRKRYDKLIKKMNEQGIQSEQLLYILTEVNNQMILIETRLNRIIDKYNDINDMCKILLS
jgi:hypothetical protein